jgi:dTDP-L-rhamnose 4-epimerase
LIWAAEPHDVRNVLITGGAGFIGSRLALQLTKRDYAVTVLDNLSTQVHTDRPEESRLYRSIEGKTRFMRGDVTNRNDMLTALAGQDVVVHFAAETGTGQSMYEIDRYCRVNIGGTALLLDILTNSKPSVSRVVIASSRSVYGEGKYLSTESGTVYPSHRAPLDMERGDFEIKHPGCNEPLTLVATDEHSKLHPSSVYGITKLSQEQLVMTVCPTIGISPVAFRYQNVYGPEQSLSNPYTGILSIFSNLIMSGKSINVFEDGLESRDFVYVDDAVDATILGIERPEAANEVFNVGSGQPVSVNTVAATLSRRLGIRVPIQISGNFRVGDIRHNYACLEKIGRLLGFAPKYDFDAGIALYCAWAKAAGSTKSDYEASLSEMRQKGLLK